MGDPGANLVQPPQLPNPQDSLVSQSMSEVAHLERTSFESCKTLQDDADRDESRPKRQQMKRSESQVCLLCSHLRFGYCRLDMCSSQRGSMAREGDRGSALPMATSLLDRGPSEATLSSFKKWKTEDNIALVYAQVKQTTIVLQRALLDAAHTVRARSESRPEQTTAHRFYLGRPAVKS